MNSSGVVMATPTTPHMCVCSTEYFKEFFFNERYVCPLNSYTRSSFWVALSRRSNSKRPWLIWVILIFFYFHTKIYFYTIEFGNDQTWVLFVEIEIISCFWRNKFDKSLILCKPEVKMKVGTRRGGSKRERNEDVGASAPVVHCPHSRSLTPPPFPLPYSLHTEEVYVFVLPISNSSTIAFLFFFFKDSLLRSISLQKWRIVPAIIWNSSF